VEKAVPPYATYGPCQRSRVEKCVHQGGLGKHVGAPPAHARLSHTNDTLRLAYVTAVVSMYRIEKVGSASARAAASTPPHRADRSYHRCLKNVASKLDIELDW
jgi:hypothetical protein